MIGPPLTVIVPVFNEVATIAALLDAVINAPFAKQVVVVDDGSTDGTIESLRTWANQARGKQPGPDLVIVHHSINRGKGAAIRSGLAHARGIVVLVQDADLEYDPNDYPALVNPILVGEAEVVYGSRYLESGRLLPWTANRVCVALLNGMVRLLYGRRISDEATCYKAFRAEDLRRMDLRCERFEFCPEVTAKVCRMGLRFIEVPIRYTPRTRLEGKKIGWKDGVEAIVTLVRWRLAQFRPTPVTFHKDDSYCIVSDT